MKPKFINLTAVASEVSSFLHYERSHLQTWDHTNPASTSVTKLQRKVLKKEKKELFWLEPDKSLPSLRAEPFKANPATTIKTTASRTTHSVLHLCMWNLQRTRGQTNMHTVPKGISFPSDVHMGQTRGICCFYKQQSYIGVWDQIPIRVFKRTCPKKFFPTRFESGNALDMLKKCGCKICI